MASLTNDLGLVKPDQTDRFLVSTLNNNMDILDEAVGDLQDDAQTMSTTVAGLSDEVGDIKTSIGGLSLVKCTQAQYDAMESHDENTVYIIVKAEED